MGIGWADPQRINPKASGWRQHPPARSQRRDYCIDCYGQRFVLVVDRINGWAYTKRCERCDGIGLE